MDERKCGVPMDDSEREEVGQAGRQGHYQRREREGDSQLDLGARLSKRRRIIGRKKEFNGGEYR
jgi:hypothetical protein